ncbi:MAG: NTP transferase domain-containing protein [Acidimicrobiales bacterium]
MRCVVLAAGRGSRLGKGHSKPLTPVVGLTLVERVIATVAGAGIDDFVVITGYHAERVEAFLAELALRRGLRITTIRNEDWPAGNGTSALAAREVVEHEFMLVMGDHIFDERILGELLDEMIDPGGAVVAADFRVGPDAIADDADATKLLVEDGRVSQIGKQLERYNAYDTGAFVCSPAVFEALEASVARGDGSLSGGMRLVAEAGRLRAVDVGDTTWVDVDTAVDARRARDCLRASLHKAEDGWVSRVLNRRVSGLVLTPLLLRLWPGVTANVVSVIGFVVALGASACFLLDQPIGAGVLVTLSSILDGSDGEIARLKRLRSPFGAYFDAVLDRYADTLMLAAGTAYTSRALDHWAIVAVGAAAVAGNLMVSYTSARSVVDLDYRYRGRWLAAGRGRDLRLFILSLGAVAAAVTPAAMAFGLALLAVITNGIVAARVALSWRLTRRWPRTDVDAVIFDLDGTVADTMPFLSDLAVELLGRYGLSPAEARRQYLSTVGIHFAGQLDELFPAHPANHDVAAEYEARKQAGFVGCHVFPDALQALAFLGRSDVPRFLASSTTRPLVTSFLEAHGLIDAFEDHEGFAPARTKDRQIEELLRRHGLVPDRVLLVGDAPRDAVLVRRLGVRFLGVHRLVPEEEFRRRGLRSVRDLGALTRLWEGEARRRSAVAPTRVMQPG